MQRDMQWDVTCCTVTSASLLAILCLQHCDAFSTRKEHHDQSTDSRSGGRPPDHSEKLCAPHHRLSAASSELDRLDASSHLGREYCGHSPPGEGLCVAHCAFHRQCQDG